MSDFQKLAHAVWQCKYHIVWCPKYRFQILRGQVDFCQNQNCRQERVKVLPLSGLASVVIVPPCLLEWRRLRSILLSSTIPIWQPEIPDQFPCRLMPRFR
jgi:hypothetical protein